MGFIYKLTFPSDKSYIGQTIRPIEERLKEHQYASSNCVAVSRAIQKYGWENVKIDWYECPDEDLNFDEELLVEEMGTLAPGGYNLREGGGATGKPSEESKQKISEALSGEKAYWYGKTLSDEHKKKLSDANLGKKHTEESKQKMSDAKSGEKNHFYGKEHTGETKQKMKEAKTGEKNHNSKRVYQYKLDGTYVDSYDSGGEAARALGKTDGSLISKCARGKQPSAYGFKWSYTEL
ncbi:GIY-YIG catalytic domain-containing endonuclease [Paramecium bursaria Chlorella virus Can18-4]|nr:GIY-YIG catalytic domain-containing endonuclease [Paramecium bursaria Chlorella virus Can18-4]